MTPGHKTQTTISLDPHRSSKGDTKRRNKECWSRKQIREQSVKQQDIKLTNHEKGSKHGTQEGKQNKQAKKTSTRKASQVSIMAETEKQANMKAQRKAKRRATRRVKWYQRGEEQREGTNEDTPSPTIRYYWISEMRPSIQIWSEFLHDFHVSIVQ